MSYTFVFLLVILDLPGCSIAVKVDLSLLNLASVSLSVTPVTAVTLRICANSCTFPGMTGLSYGGMAKITL